MAQIPPRRYSSDPKRRAEQLVAEGRIGGPRKGAGRPRKHTPERPPPRPAAAAVAAAAREHSGQIAKVFTDALESDELTDAQKVAAMRTFLGIEDRETDRASQASREGTERDLSGLSRDELEADLIRRLANPLIRDALRAALDVPPEAQ